MFAGKLFSLQVSSQNTRFRLDPATKTTVPVLFGTFFQRSFPAPCQTSRRRSSKTLTKARKFAACQTELHLVTTHICTIHAAAAITTAKSAHSVIVTTEQTAGLSFQDPSFEASHGRVLCKSCRKPEAQSQTKTQNKTHHHLRFHHCYT